MRRRWAGRLTPSCLSRQCLTERANWCGAPYWTILISGRCAPGITAVGKDLFVANFFGDVPQTVIAPALLFGDVTVRRANEKERQVTVLSAAWGLKGMDKKPLYLWCAYPDDLLADGAAEACVALLSEEERARVQRFKFERHRRESLATRALMRTALSYGRSGSAAGLAIQAECAGQAGRSRLRPDCGLQFNLSNSLGLVVCLVAEGGRGRRGRGAV